jgi:hypothetical protein
MEWNSCSNLTKSKEYEAAHALYESLLGSEIDPFMYMFNMQRDLQFALSAKSPKYNPSPDNLKTIGEKFDWIRENKQAFDDEYREIIDALPGMSLPDKDRSAVWKRWKTKYEDIRSRTFDDLSKDELHELKFEFVDSFHFYMNMMFALDIDPEQLFVYYYAKNVENHERAKNGY